MPEKSNKVAVWFLLIAFCLASSASQAAESLPPLVPEGEKLVKAEQILQIVHWKHKNPFRSVAVSPDGKLCVTSCDDGSVHVWNLVTGQEIEVITEHTKPVYAIAFSPDGKKFATGSMDRSLVLWDSKTLKIIYKWDVVVNKYTVPIYNLSFRPDGEVIAAGVPMGALLFDIKTKKFNFVSEFSGALCSNDLAMFLKDNNTLMTELICMKITFWDTSTREIIREFKSNFAKEWAIHPEQKTIGLAYDGGKIEILSFFSGQPIKQFHPHKKDITSLDYSSDGRLLASGSKDKSIKMIDLENDSISILGAHEDEVYDIEFTPDGKRLISVSKDGTARVWNVAEKKQERVLFGGENRTWISCDSEGMCLRGDDKTLVMQKDKTGEYAWVPENGRINLTPAAANEKLVSPAPPAQAKAQTDEDQTEPAPKTPWKRWFVLIIAILLLTGMSAYMRRKR